MTKGRNYTNTQLDHILSKFTQNELYGLKMGMFPAKIARLKPKLLNDDYIYLMSNNSLGNY
jgi:hypothetical protein